MGLRIAVYTAERVTNAVRLSGYWQKEVLMR